MRFVQRLVAIDVHVELRPDRRYLVVLQAEHGALGTHLVEGMHEVLGEVVGHAAGVLARVVWPEVFDTLLQGSQARVQILDVLFGGKALSLQLLQPHVTQGFDVLDGRIGGEEEAVVLLLLAEASCSLASTARCSGVF